MMAERELGLGEMKKKLQVLNGNSDGIGVDHYHHDSQSRSIPWELSKCKQRKKYYALWRTDCS